MSDLETCLVLFYCFSIAVLLFCLLHGEEQFTPRQKVLAALFWPLFAVAVGFQWSWRGIRAFLKQ